MLVGSRNLFIQLINLNLIDEFQICIHPLIEGKGLPLFDKIKDRTIFRLLKTKIFISGANNSQHFKKF
ncbi:dihydrofolate reductase family protein [Adhaeribacter pallidiroseus]|uniref:dihydrofolate reductase family protein n=1 Tax=Adhaeribacter pallidiroseus TaxID=2072847 RepID=UPI001F223D33|nr:dihydrofolate reductase family protein [Adhaeribacter pallidiroseus]